jgi:Leucine-rich repeat (LRR) protein
LSHNDIEIIETDSFNSLTALEELYLQSNNLKNVYNMFCNQNSLKIINLSNNKIQLISSNHFGRMLIMLDLSYNDLFELNLDPLNLFNLGSLNLAKTNASLISNLNLSSLKSLKSLDLSNNHFDGKILANLISLESLNLRNTNLSNYLFLEKMINLTDLDISYNMFNNLNLWEESRFKVKLKASASNIRNSDVFKYNLMLVQFIYLNLSHNDLTEMYDFTSWDELEIFDLSFNRISVYPLSKTPSDYFYALISLSYLQLTQSFSETFSKARLYFNQNLEYAFMSNNNIKVFPKFCEYNDKCQFESCKLKTLHLNKNNLEKIQILELFYLNNLEVLNLEDNKISEIESNAFNSLISLQALILSKNRLDYLQRDLFNVLDNLKYLYLSQNNISYIQALQFDNLLKLEVLDLSFNQLHAIYKDGFNRLSNLRDLFLNGNYFKMVNGSFNGLDSIQTIYISKSIINSFTKDIFIQMASSRNKYGYQIILNRYYYKTFNLITLNEFDCELTIKFIRYNIHFNLKSSTEIYNYLTKC